MTKVAMSKLAFPGRGALGPLLAAALLAVSAAASWAGGAITVSRSADIDKPAEEVWALIGEFAKLDTWHPAVESVTLSGDGGSGVHRLLKLNGGGEIDETLLNYSLTDKSYSYVINASPLPVANYNSTLSVTENGNGSTILWVSTFEPVGVPDEEADKIIGGIYEAGFASVAEKLKN
jgi:carbon monoxide dehydrogenase subunit G